MTKDDKDSPLPLTQHGVFVIRGMQLAIPAGGLVIAVGEDGNLTGELRALHLRIDMCARWMAIAYQHLLAAESAHKEVLEAARNNKEEDLGSAIERETDAGMQAISASCTAVDAYYALLREHTKIDEQTLESWRSNRTARYIQIAEVVRRTFKIPQAVSDQVRSILQQAFPIRDDSLHPTGKMSDPMMYEEIGRSTARWLVVVRHENAKMVVGQCLMVIAATIACDLRQYSQEFSDTLKWTAQLVAPIVVAWQEHYGPLGDPAPPFAGKRQNSSDRS